MLSKCAENVRRFYENRTPHTAPAQNYAHAAPAHRTPHVRAQPWAPRSKMRQKMRHALKCVKKQQKCLNSFILYIFSILLTMLSACTYFFASEAQRLFLCRSRIQKKPYSKISEPYFCEWELAIAKNF
jgi:hypothetical protein